MSDKKQGNYGISKRTAIELNAYVDEINKRERKFNVINDVFTLNIKRLHILPEKPNKYKFHSAVKAEDIPYEIRNQVNEYFKTPHEKYEKPMTSSMGYGWDKESGFKVFKKLYSKNSDQITKFASEYCYLTGKSPFASNKIVSSSQKK